MLDNDSLRYVISMSNVPSTIMFMRTCKRLKSLIDAETAATFENEVKRTVFIWDIPEEMLFTRRVRSSTFTTGTWPLPEYDWTL